jgi:HPt (histidine-containing phosphotransfer) domain-containing protein
MGSPVEARRRVCSKDQAQIGKLFISLSLTSTRTINVNPKQKEAFEALRKKYLNGIPEKILNIRKMITTNETHLLQQEFHKIKGSGKTYGYPDVTLIAFHIDKHCKMGNPNMFVLAEKACVLLQKIYDSHTTQQSYDLQNDPLFKEIQ